MTKAIDSAPSSDAGVHVIDLDGTSALDRELVGGKAWGVNLMTGLGMPVPPAFAVTVPSVSTSFRHDDAVFATVRAHLGRLEHLMGATFGSRVAPLLVSVRSSSAVSMPGMMDTFLDVGVPAATQHPRLAVKHRRFADRYRALVAPIVPEDPWEQLYKAIRAVALSYDNPRARTYRKLHSLSDSGGTAVVVQAMVHGDSDERSGTGVLFTREPMTGAPGPYGEWLPTAVGEDLVSGMHTPLPISALASVLPEMYEELRAAGNRLETHLRHVQDVEFTVQSGRLWLLQTRPALLAAEAHARSAAALYREGVINPRQLVDRLRPEHLAALTDRLAAVPAARPILCGVAASPGFASGVLVDSTVEAQRRAQLGEPVVLARPTTDPADVPGMAVARAIVTGVGGATCHAAIVCRELGRPCVVACGTAALAALTGQLVTVDGSTGQIFAGQVPTSPISVEDPDLAALRTWVAAADIPVPPELRAALFASGTRVPDPQAQSPQEADDKDAVQ